MLTSIIIPTLNESTTIRQTAESVAGLCGDIEMIIADGGSDDGTAQIARDIGLRVTNSPRGRGCQMNAGAQLASGEILVFLHADTRLPHQATTLIENALKSPEICGGNFNLIFDGDTRAARLLTKIYPFLRMGGMCYGDSAIFIRRRAFEELGGYRNYPIFEDCDLYRRMRRIGKFIHIDACATTSSRRFEGRFIRTFALWTVMHVLYWVGVDPHLLNRLYKPLR